jgi:hypothetical protein
MQTNDTSIWPNVTIQFYSSALFKYRMPGSPSIGQVIILWIVFFFFYSC